MKHNYKSNLIKTLADVQWCEEPELTMHSWRIRLPCVRPKMTQLQIEFMRGIDMGGSPFCSMIVSAAKDDSPRGEEYLIDRASLRALRTLLNASDLSDDYHREIEVAAKLLANEHIADGDGGIIKILWAKHPSEIRLIEVDSRVGDCGDVMPFRFAADPPDVPFKYVVIAISLNDWARVQANELKLPDGFEQLEVLHDTTPERGP